MLYSWGDNAHAALGQRAEDVSRAPKKSCTPARVADGAFVANVLP
jgi:hypothetical protein